jgi:HAMP domain-containing protein
LATAIRVVVDRDPSWTTSPQGDAVCGHSASATTYAVTVAADTWAIIGTQLITMLGLLYFMITRMDALARDLRGEIGQVRGEIGQVRGEIGQLGDELRGEMGQLEGRLRGEIVQLGAHLGARIDRQTARIDAHIERHAG